MRLFARWGHVYTDPEGITYELPGGEWRDVPPAVAHFLAAAHPQKLVVLRPGQNHPDDQYEAAVITEPPIDRQMKRRGKR